MKSPFDFANDISKMKLLLDYDNYQDDLQKNEYRTNNLYDQSLEPATPTQGAPVRTFAVSPNTTNQTLIDTSDYAEDIDNDDYVNEGNSRAVRRAMRKTNRISNRSSGSDGPFGSINGKGQGFAGAIPELANFGTGQLAMFQNEAGSEKEGWASVGNSTLSGAAAGFAVGGPIGGIIGAGVGQITGAVDFFTDSNKRDKKTRDEYDKMLEANTTKRKQEWAMAQGEQSINKLSKLRKAQLNYINLDF